jgi:hypothetical protein
MPSTPSTSWPGVRGVGKLRVQPHGPPERARPGTAMLLVGYGLAICWREGFVELIEKPE